MDAADRTTTLSLSRAEEWTLHHLLADRIHGEGPASTDGDPPAELVGAFEALDAGDRRFTVAQLEAIRSVLSAYHHAPSWELERPRIEAVLAAVSGRIEAGDDPRPAQ